MPKSEGRKFCQVSIASESEHSRHDTRHALGVFRYPPPVMLSHHRCVGMPELPGHPFDRDVAGQHLAGKGVTTLVRPAMTHLRLFQVGGKPVAQCLATPE